MYSESRDDGRKYRPIGKGGVTSAPALLHMLRRSTFSLTNDLKKIELIKNIDSVVPF